MNHALAPDFIEDVEEFCNARQDRVYLEMEKIPLKSSKQIIYFRQMLPPNLLPGFIEILSTLTEEEIKRNQAFYSEGFWDARKLFVMSRHWREG